MQNSRQGFVSEQRVNMGGFLESRYAELKCRVCKMSFCCKNCRRSHEAKVHHIHPDCDVCIYGRISISRTQISGELLQHLKDCHWPLHCVWCKKVYESLDNIDEHHFGCPGILDMPPPMSDETPPRELVVDQKQRTDYLTPEMMVVDGSGGELMTSTPMVANQMAIQVPDNITPVDAERVHSGIAEELTRTAPSLSSPKKVTFISTPAVENIKKKRKKPDDFLKICLRNSMRLNASASTTGSFRSARDSLPKSHVTSFIEEPVASPKRSAKRLSQSHSETLWTSAINNTLELAAPAPVPAPLSVPVISISHHLSFEEERAAREHYMQDAGTSYDAAPQETSVWTSMTSMFKNIVKSFKPTKPEQSNPLKRNRSVSDMDKDVEERILKRHKFCDVRCRPTIRPLWKRLVPTADKAVQTDFYDEH